MACDIVLVGVGGQGVLTIGDLLVRAAFAADIPASFCPTKGMAQRGGFVKAELRLGAEGGGPRIDEASADLVVAMERSEALRAIYYIKPSGHFLLYDHVWEPTGVQLGVDDYPSLEDVSSEIEAFGAALTVLEPADLPKIDDRKASPNVFLLGAAVANPRVADLVGPEVLEQVLAARWPKQAELNLAAFRAGMTAGQTAATEDRADAVD